MVIISKTIQVHNAKLDKQTALKILMVLSAPFTVFKETEISFIKDVYTKLGILSAHLMVWDGVKDISMQLPNLETSAPTGSE